jgi:transcriptional regulator of acetoin/glycerol metabolism
MTVSDMVAAGFTMKDVLRQARRAAIFAMLIKTDGNQCEAARKLKIHRNTVFRIAHRKEI